MRDNGPRRGFWRWSGRGKHGWQYPDGMHGPPPWARAWPHHWRGIVLRLIVFVSLMGLLVGSFMALLAFLLTHFFGGDGHTMRLVWLGGCGLALALPFLAAALSFRTVRGVALPLRDIMVAIDAVANGDLGVRVPEQGRGEMSRLAHAFNHMIDELARTDQQRRNLTADVAHELRTPLHIIQGNLEGILDGVYQPIPEHIEATLEETRLLTRLVDDLRTLSLAESGELPLQRQLVDVADLLADALTSFSGQAEAAGVTLQTAPPAADATGANSLLVEGDADRLDQVLSNLLTNAIRHTPAGGSVTLGAAATDGHVQIIVADTGQGIEPEHLPFIFDRFWRGDRARSHSSGVGSGLGLSIANQLIKAHGGEIEAASEVGQGTIFVITLPAAKSEDTI